MRGDATDGDEELARQLQEEEDALAMRQRYRADDQRRTTIFVKRLMGGLSFWRRYGSDAEHAAREALPFDELRRKAAEKEDEGSAEEDQFVRELLRYFKDEFFEWFDHPICLRCRAEDEGKGKMKCEGRAPPSTAEEQRGEASVVECYACPSCSYRERFPRYNNPVTLLSTRKGRCGEWANAFCLCLHAAGLDARLCIDWTDHVWTEYYSRALRRWICCDPCEKSWNEPLLYEKGWGKKLTYVIAYGRLGVHDVTGRYVQSMAETMKRRNEIDEGTLEHYTASLSFQLRRDYASNAFPGSNGCPGRPGGSPEEDEFWQRLRQRDIEERDEINGGSGNASCATAAGEDLPGRQSGSVQWRRDRGELGPNLPGTSSRGVAGGEEGGDRCEAPKSRPEGASALCSTMPAEIAASSTGSIPEKADFESKLKAEFTSVQRENPELSPNEAALEAIRRLKLESDD